ncbi:exosome complex component RRP43-like [Chiroxiphia lanceolata]|uniref:exosome complex component RRP43-like n=1 Tax=Chiroxiphia lanceolata TaxID=296741 RepID=UPI0013CEBE41|nr:exosome complex component RRP43-like [Chiroxiphia lanceolata]
MRGGGGAAMAAAFKTVEPLEYYKRFLKENCRPDGRELSEFQATTVNIGSITTADGSALVKLGSTTVICGVKAVWNLLHLQQILLIRDILLAWVLYCDIICLDYDGNLLDASVFALLAALKNVQLPSVIIHEETGLSEVNLKQKTPLIIRKHPVATSFAVFDDTVLIVDPTAEEEDLATGTVTIVTDEKGRLCSVHKPGGSPLTGAKLQDCITRAVTRHKEVKKLIDKVIKSIMPK